MLIKYNFHQEKNNLNMKTVIYLTLVLLLDLATNLTDGAYQNNQCQYEIVESMPEKLTFTNSLSFQPKPTERALIDMLNNATETVRIVSFYITLTAEEEFASHPSALPGRNIMKAIVAAKKRGVDVEVILDRSGKQMSNEADIDLLKSTGSRVKFLNMTSLMGSGVLHTKFMITDNSSLYVGSSNFDWRSYSQIKEIGIKFDNCHVISSDLDKVFQLYSLISDLKKIPTGFPKYLNTTINIEKPLELDMSGSKMNIYLGSSPPPFNGLEENWNGRTDDIDGLLSTIDSARHKIDISVMNYSPTTQFMWPKRFWPAIDVALRRAAVERHVSVRMLISDWSHIKPEELMWYKSLDAVKSPALKGGSISVKMFQVPAFDEFQRSIPYARVKHDKYMVTDNGLYIGTSNWAADYFINTCGVSFVIKLSENDNKTTIISQMTELFDRDYNSRFTHDLKK